jgi:cell division ATPase FtsA
MVRAIYPFATYPVSEKNTAIINLGANLTEIVIYQNQILRDIIHIPLGGEAIIQDMIKLTKIDPEKARSLLFSYENIFSTLKNRSLSQSIHHQIIDSRLKEIFNMIKKALEVRGIREVVLVGGLRNLKQLPQILGNYLKVSFQLPAPTVPHFYVSSLEVARY